MLGRGIDQILPYPSSPRLYEPYVRDARQYVALSERKNGPLPRPVSYQYIWGDFLTELNRIGPDLRLINLETAVTASPTPWPEKGINYRMNPANLPVLTTAGIDVAGLANNHVLDWGREGLAETLAALRAAGIATAGAGSDLASAEAPAAVGLKQGGRALVFAFGMADSGIPEEWAATAKRSGVTLLTDFSKASVLAIGQRVARWKRKNDLAIASIHWGSNWGYGVPRDQQSFARNLVESAGIDLVHGHSSHHPRPLEVFRGQLIIYGCGDFLNDYEGISGQENFRPDLTLAFFPRLAPENGRLLELRLVPLRLQNFRLRHASGEDAAWLAAMLTREGRRFGTSVELNPDGRLQLSWSEASGGQVGC